jgi:hypothetical protein
MSRLAQNLYSTSIELKTVIVNVRKTGKQRRSCERGEGIEELVVEKEKRGRR